MNIIDFRDLYFRYQNAPKKFTLKDINLDIQKGEFVLIIGPSGSGKSTLVRCINGLIPHFYGGKISGEVLVKNKSTLENKPNNLASDIGYVFQNPENQLVMNKVESEVAFPMQNLQFPLDKIKSRVDHALEDIGIEELKEKSNNDLSAGQKQKVAIASAIASKPELLILDEPTAELDPISAREILTLVRKLNKKYCITVLLIEHRISRVLEFTDRVILVNKGKVILDGDPKTIFSATDNIQTLSKFGIEIPPMVKISQNFSLQSGYSIEKISHELKKKMKNTDDIASVIEDSLSAERSNMENYLNSLKDNKELIHLENIDFTYENGTSVFKGISLQIKENEFVGIIGRNGSGKSTLLKICNGLLRPKKGNVYIDGKNSKKMSVAKLSNTIGYIFQNPAKQFYLDTVEEEIQYILKNHNYSKNKIESRTNEILAIFDLEKYRYSYPRYLSIGEQQKVALATILSVRPKVLLLDEPTHGMDYREKIRFLEYLENYRKAGNAVVLVTHDVEMLAKFSQRIILIGEQQILDDDLKHQVLTSNKDFYPQTTRITDQIFFHEKPMVIRELMKHLNQVDVNSSQNKSNGGNCQ